MSRNSLLLGFESSCSHLNIKLVFNLGSSINKIGERETDGPAKSMLAYIGEGES